MRIVLAKYIRVYVCIDDCVVQVCVLYCYRQKKLFLIGKYSDKKSVRATGDNNETG